MALLIIEKDVPIPDKRSNDPYIRDALLSMANGDSFLVATDRERNCVGVVAKRLGVKVLSRKVENGIRIWRIAP